MQAVRMISDDILVYTPNPTQKTFSTKKSYIFIPPVGDFFVLFFSLSSKLHPLVKVCVENKIGVVYLCEEIPSDAIYSEHIVYLRCPPAWFIHTLFINPLLFKAVLADDRAYRFGNAFSQFTQYQIPFFKTEVELKNLKQNYSVYSKNILLEITGGVGDHLLCIPTIKTLAARGFNVHILCEGHRKDVFLNLPYIKKFFSHRTEINISQFSKIYILHFGQFLNDYRVETNKQNRIYAIAEVCDIPKEELVINYPEIILTQEEEWYSLGATGGLHNTVFFGFDSDRVDARMPSDLTQEIINSLSNKKWTPIITSLRSYEYKNCVNLSKKLTVRQLFALIWAVDRVLTVDTSFLHIAAAFKKPTICLMNYFKNDWRCSTYPSVTPYNPIVSCYPCVAKQFVATSDRMCNKQSCYKFFQWDKIIEEF